MTYGPIDFLAVEFNNENLKGEILPALYELVVNKIVRVIDMVIIQKDKDGQHVAVEVQQLAPEIVSIFDPLNAEISGLIQVEDIDMVAEAMENDTTAAVLLFENLWAIKFKETLLRAKGRLITQLRVPQENVDEALQIFANA